MTVAITSFSGKYRFLSNFYIEPDGSCVEMEFQAAKTEDPAWQNKILAAKSPGEAKRLGRQAPLRPEWEEIKLGVMSALVMRKFSDHPLMRAKLLDTAPAELIEGNTWGDTFWGVDGTGENWLGKILMDTRTILRALSVPPPGLHAKEGSRDS